MPKTTEELIHILIGGYTGENYIISSDDVIIPEYIEKNIRDDFEFLKQANLIRNYSKSFLGGTIKESIFCC